jgi:hypothetical protein
MVQSLAIEERQLLGIHVRDDRRKRALWCNRSGRPRVVLGDCTGNTHLARGASNGGTTFHDRGGPFGRTKAPSALSPST